MASLDNAFATETAAMRTLPFSSASQIDWSFRIGLSAVILVAAAEIFSVGYYYVGQRYPRVATPTTATAPKVASVATPAPQATAAPSASAAPSVAAAESPATSTLSAADRLLKEATTLREKGDTATALSRLQQASQSDPKNANVLAEMATIYESIDQYERSNETWRKVQDIGPAAGSVYELAMLKLKQGAAATPAPEASVAETTTSTTAARTSEGIPEGSTFGITEVTTSETPDPDAETNMLLRIAVKKKPNTVVDHTKVKIQVFFYDTVNDKDIKLTDAEVNYEWLTQNHDWAGPNAEVLAVTYVRPKNKARSQEESLSAAAQAIIPGKKARPTKPTAPDDSGRRKYLGYIVRVYYNDKLQTVRADPTKLLNLFPPPNTASSP